MSGGVQMRLAALTPFLCWGYLPEPSISKPVLCNRKVEQPAPRFKCDFEADSDFRKLCPQQLEKFVK